MGVTSGEGRSEKRSAGAVQGSGRSQPMIPHKDESGGMFLRGGGVRLNGPIFCVDFRRAIFLFTKESRL